MSKESADSSITKISKAYADQSVVRAIVNLIPYLGGSLDVLLSTKGEKIVQRRIEDFLSELNLQVAQLNETKVNKTFLESEEGFDLIVKTFNSAARTRQNSKLKLYARIIKGAVTNDKVFAEDDPETFLRIVEELTPRELKIAKILFELKGVRKQSPDSEPESKDRQSMSNDAFWIAGKYPEYKEEELTSIFVRLEKTGLIKEVVGNYIGYGGGQYLINQLFRDFVTFIDEIPIEEDL